MDNFIIISGGPGSGKTTLIEALAAMGHGRTIEAGRFITQAQVAIGGEAVHWADFVTYAELMLMHEIRSYEEARDAKGLVFFDRSVPEVQGYLPMMGRPSPAHFARAAELYPYNRRVFLAPPWQEIFVNDAERKQDFAEAVRSYEWCVKTYREAGYDTLDLPKSPVPERVRFVLDRVSR